MWRDAGIERPLTCRMGIHTGYCTVGNFGSDDRVSYTAVGGAVNLASRLEGEAPAGGILISYETYAHIKDEVSCEEVGKISVKGIAYPITTYRVIEDFEKATETEVIRARLPHLTLNLDPRRMTADEQGNARHVLENALERLGARPVHAVAGLGPGPAVAMPLRPRKSWGRRLILGLLLFAVGGAAVIVTTGHIDVIAALLRP